MKRSLHIIGKTGLTQVQQVNGQFGTHWVAALDVAAQQVISDYPAVTSMSITGAKAHPSHQVQGHSNIISTAYYAGDHRVISGHVHINGQISYSEKEHKGSSRTENRWQPTRDQVDQAKWVIYDPEKKQNRKVEAEGQWWVIVKGGDKVYF